MVSVLVIVLVCIHVVTAASLTTAISTASTRNIHSIITLLTLLLNRCCAKAASRDLPCDPVQYCPQTEVRRLLKDVVCDIAHNGSHVLSAAAGLNERVILLRCGVCGWVRDRKRGPFQHLEIDRPLLWVCPVDLEAPFLRSLRALCFQPGRNMLRSCLSCLVLHKEQGRLCSAQSEGYSRVLSHASGRRVDWLRSRSATFAADSWCCVVNRGLR